MIKLGSANANNPIIIEFCRYSVIGISTNLMCYFLYLILTNQQFEPKKSMTFVYLLGVIISIFANGKWTFSNKIPISILFTRAFIIYLLGYLINFLLLLLLSDRYHYPHQWVQLIAIMAVALFIFFSFKLLVFKIPSQ